MKRLLILSSELLAFIAIGFLLGRFLDKKLLWEGWATIGCVFLAYILWFINFYRHFRSE